MRRFRDGQSSRASERPLRASGFIQRNAAGTVEALIRAAPKGRTGSNGGITSAFECHVQTMIRGVARQTLSRPGERTEIGRIVQVDVSIAVRAERVDPVGVKNPKASGGAEDSRERRKTGMETGKVR
jgi:hypothetical protein